MLSHSLEEYLKTMYVLYRQNGNIRVTDIANKLNYSKASVNKAINNLKEKGLIKYETYGKIELTEEAIEIAKKSLEAYDIVKVFLKDVLSINEVKAEEEAEKIKSVIDDETLNHLAKYIQKELDLNDLSCGYNISNQKCISCARRNSRKEVI